MHRHRPYRPAIVATIVAIFALSLALPAAASLGLLSGSSAAVAFTDGDGVNVRVAPSIWSDAIAALPEAFEVTIVDGPVTGDDGWSWYAVLAWTFYGPVEGWVRADFLTGDAWAAAPAGFEGPPDDSASAASGVPVFVSTGGAALDVRGGPSYAFGVDAYVPDGAWVDVLDTIIWDSDGNSWTLIHYGGLVGYAATGYLFSGLSVPSGSVVESGGDVIVGGYAAVAGTSGLGVNVRGGPDVGTGILTALFEDTLVHIGAGPVYDVAGDGWYQIYADGTYGWVNGRYLAPASNGRALASYGGASIVDLSYAYMGVPYLWGGTTPDGFDCSGFTWFILSSLYGDWYPRPMEDQISLGSWVAPENLLPGDVIYFQNTYQWGVSHVGFYVGDGQFISASGEHMAVGVSSLHDPYWSARYLTARRID
ncbi:MAG TPA: SH3 domain-containing C40 family peptidase [Thermomicrobiales bacterium]|nr:SH3 domain-containing C40 family peptidase [Thermomicrobiales bacterium]